MKSSKLTPYDRRVRREKIMEKRGNTILAHKPRRAPTDLYPHSNTRQRARYARQTGYVAPIVQIKPKRIRKTGASA